MALTPDQEKLKEAALAASPGPWKGDRLDGTVKYELLDANGKAVIAGNNGNCDNGPYGIMNDEDERYLMAANPAAILAILAQLEQVQGDAARYNLLFNIDNFCQDELWTVVDWMRGGPDDPTKADVDAALDEYAAKQAAAVQPLPPPPEAA